MKTLKKVNVFIIAAVLASLLGNVVYALDYPASGFNFLDVVASSNCTLTRGVISGTYKNGYAAVSVDFGTGNVYDSVTISVGVPKSNSGGTIYVRLDSPIGEEIAALKVQPTTGGWTDRQPQTALIENGEISGVHSVYFVFSITGVGDISYAKFNGGSERTVPSDLKDENDAKLYKKLDALKLLSHDVKTNFRPQKLVTNDEMLTMLLTEQYMYMKDDIASRFEINKSGYATFRDVACASLQLLGYNDFFEYGKGSLLNNPDGYYTYAQKWKLFDGIEEVAPDRRVNKSEMLTIINNVLNFTTDRIVSVKNDIVYRKGESGESIYLNYKRLEGVVTQTQYTNLNGWQTLSPGKIGINSQVYDTNFNNMDEFLGYNIEFYTNSDDAVCYATKYNNEELYLTSYEIDDVSGGTFTYTPDSENKQKKIVIPSDINVIYNGQLITDYTNDIFRPQDGDITFIDSDSNKSYDTAVINNIGVFIVDTISDDVIYSKNKVDAIDLNDANAKYIIKRSGGNEGDKEFLTTSLREWSVLAVGRSVSSSGSKVYTIQVCSDKAKGVVESVTKGEILNAEIDGRKVEISPNAYYSDNVGDIRVGEEVTVFINKWGKGMFVRYESQSSYRFGYIAKMSLNVDEPFENSVKLMILNDEGDLDVIKVRDKVVIDGSLCKTAKSAYEILSKNETRTNIFSRYKVNSKGEITEIDLPYDYSDDTPSGLGKDETLESLHMTASGKLRYKTSSKSFGGLAMVKSDPIVFSVPIDSKGEVDTSQKDSFGVGKKTYINDSSYNIEAYSISTDSFVSDIIVEKVKPINIGVDAINSSIDLSLVDGFDEIYSSESDEIKKRLVYWKGGEKGAAVLSTQCREVVESGNYNKGDAVRFSTNASGEIDNILKVYDFKTNTITGTNSSEYNAENRFSIGKVAEKKGAYMRLDSSREIFNLSGAAVYAYYSDKDIITNATIDDIVSQQASGSGDNVLVWLRYTDTRLVLILKD